jgi:hypothetical protein
MQTSGVISETKRQQIKVLDFCPSKIAKNLFAQKID